MSVCDLISCDCCMQGTPGFRYGPSFLILHQITCPATRKLNHFIWKPARTDKKDVHPQNICLDKFCLTCVKHVIYNDMQCQCVTYKHNVHILSFAGNGGEIQWCFSQVKGTIEEDITEGRFYYLNFLSVFFIHSTGYPTCFMAFSISCCVTYLGSLGLDVVILSDARILEMYLFALCFLQLVLIE